MPIDMRLVSDTSHVSWRGIGRRLKSDRVCEYTLLLLSTIGEMMEMVSSWWLDVCIKYSHSFAIRLRRQFEYCQKNRYILLYLEVLLVLASWRKIGPDRADPDPAQHPGYGYIDFSEHSVLVHVTPLVKRGGQNRTKFSWHAGRIEKSAARLFVFSALLVN